MKYQVLEKHSFGNEISDDSIKYLNEELESLVSNLDRYKHDDDYYRILGFSDAIRCLGLKICDIEGNIIRPATHFSYYRKS